jgi:hypothetical protein
MSEKDFQRIIKSIDSETAPPQGLKERMLEQILILEENDSSPSISKIERLIFERPLRAAFAISAVISVILWIAVGNGYTSSLSYLIGIR